MYALFHNLLLFILIKLYIIIVWGVGSLTERVSSLCLSHQLLFAAFKVLFFARGDDANFITKTFCNVLFHMKTAKYMPSIASTMVCRNTTKLGSAVLYHCATLYFPL